LLQHRLKSLKYGGVCTSAKPLFDLASHGRFVATQPTRKPKFENLLEVFSHQYQLSLVPTPNVRPRSRERRHVPDANQLGAPALLCGVRV
jgi:hypothetical protein